MKNTMKKILCTALVVVIMFGCMPIDTNAYLLETTYCVCVDHIDTGPCTCCIMCQNLDKTSIADCATKVEQNGETYWQLCCEECTGLRDCTCGGGCGIDDGCGCDECKKLHSWEEGDIVIILPSCATVTCSYCGETKPPSSGHLDENNDNKCEK